MACRCDDYYDSNREALAKTAAADEHEKRCHAQSLVNKLACILEKNNIKIPVKLKNNIAACRTDLAKHKRLENKKDVTNLNAELTKLKNKIKNILGLGGLVPESMHKNIDSIKEEIKTLESLYSDQDFLGDETT